MDTMLSCQLVAPVLVVVVVGRYAVSPEYINRENEMRFPHLPPPPPPPAWVHSLDYCYLLHSVFGVELTSLPWCATGVLFQIPATINQDSDAQRKAARDYPRLQFLFSSMEVDGRVGDIINLHTWPTSFA